MNAITLYDFELDENCYKVRLFLSVLGLPYTKINVDMLPGAEQKRPPLSGLNPLGTLPVLTDATDAEEPVILRDAESILAYLAVRHDLARRWLPELPRAFGEVMTWLTFSARDLAAAVSARLEAIFGSSAAAPEASAARACFRIMDDHMTAREFQDRLWFAGEGPSLADIVLFPAIALSRDTGIDHEAYPALRRWMRRVRALPGFIAMPGIPDYH